MEQEYRIEGVSLTVQMPAELDHPNAERLKKETDYYLENYHIQHIIFYGQFRDRRGRRPLPSVEPAGREHGGGPCEREDRQDPPSVRHA